jgi:hypothetical protein
MSEAFGDARTFSTTETAKKMMNELKTKGLFKDVRHVWMLGASIGISTGNVSKEGKKETFENVNSLDPDGVFAAVMMGLYPDLTPKERAEKLQQHAEWGVREIHRKDKNGTLDFAKL